MGKATGADRAETMLTDVGESASDLGEFRLIERLLSRVRGVSSDDEVIGPGDDAALLPLAGDSVIASTDLLIEGTHFDLALSSFEDVGWKALAVNVSDIAAMGASPAYALIGLGAPPGIAVADLERLYGGLGACARAFGVTIAGGDTVRSETLAIAVTVLGNRGSAAPVRRSGAAVGDALCVTGALGAASAGLALLRGARRGDQRASELLDRFPALGTAHRRPVPRVREGQAAANAGVTAMIDVSDGLGQDLDHICAASGVGARVDRAAVPIADGVAEVAAWSGVDPIRFAVGGGDDYELVMAVKPERVDAVIAAIAPTPLTRIGEVTHGDRASLADGSQVVDLSRSGWDSFREEA